VVEPERIQFLNDRDASRGKYVLYWMQASQRAEFNHALEYAVQQANERNQPVVAVFGLTEQFPEANERHYAFMLQGLSETQAALKERGIQLVVLGESPEAAALALADRASLVVADCGYLRIQKAWRQHVAQKATCSVIQVESDVVVPVEVASGKEEYAAATLRPKLHRHIEHFLRPLEPMPVRKDSLGLRFDRLDIDDWPKILAGMRIDRGVGQSRHYRGGGSQAKQLLDTFIRSRLEGYAELRGDPSLGVESHMSPYLHFGQISPVYVALRVRKEHGRYPEAVESYLEELIVRRELSVNFVHFNRDYDSYAALPAWARATLRVHAADRRSPAYGEEELELGRTDDPYWNAAMCEMVLTGKMHNYMRMYWGKKILEWTRRPEEAYRIALYLNNKYFIDGRDPNSFAGVAWCFGKHDRPWTERPIFGKVRYMNAAGLERKFDVEAYVRQVERLRSGA